MEHTQSGFSNKRIVITCLALAFIMMGMTFIQAGFIGEVIDYLSPKTAISDIKIEIKILENVTSYNTTCYTQGDISPEINRMEVK